ncbi:MAG: class I SAM-dependent methyltransferase [Planctomycetota bacterium]
MSSILTTGKDGYSPDGEFDRRTRAAVAGEPSEWGDPAALYARDAVEVMSFIRDDYGAVARVLSELEGYSILDLGCGYGRLAPLLSAFDCERYLGVDRVGGRVDLALGRYASGVCDFERADALAYRSDETFDVVWTSNVMQHLLLPDKFRFVETAKAACAPGGRIIMREAEIVDGTLADAERRYADPAHPRHMVPVPRAELERAFAPMRLERLGGIVWLATA